MAARSLFVCRLAGSGLQFSTPNRLTPARHRFASWAAPAVAARILSPLDEMAEPAPRTRFWFWLIAKFGYSASQPASVALFEKAGLEKFHFFVLTVSL